jgi:hypothetical protein
MKLYEFFGGRSNDTDSNPSDDLSGKTKVEQEKLSDELYWFILDDDELHKKHFIPVARELAKRMKDESFDHSTFTSKWMPMINKGCLKFYKKNEMTEDPKDVFPKELRKALCQRFADEHHKDIQKGDFRLG